MPQILTRTIRNSVREVSLSLRWIKEILERGGGIGGEHQIFANEKGVKAGGAQLLQIVVGPQAGFADGKAIFGNMLDQFVGSLHAHRKGFQVAVVYSDDSRTGRKRAGEFFERVNLDERLHAEFAAQSD